MGLPADFEAHLRSGATTLCRAWALTRRDGVVYGFTDHDMDLSFYGIVFRADSGLAARRSSRPQVWPWITPKRLVCCLMPR